MIEKARDILIDISDYDILMSDSSDKDELIFDVVWGSLYPEDNADTLYANVVVPERHSHILCFNDDGVFMCKAMMSYIGQQSTFVVRFVKPMPDGSYVKYSNSIEIPQDLTAYGYLASKSIISQIMASEIMQLNNNGKVRLVVRKETNPVFNKCEIYSCSSMDFSIGECDNQNANTITLCNPGNYYRFPTVGVGVTDYLNSIVSRTKLGSKMLDQFSQNLIPIQSASFNTSTGDMKASFSPEQTESMEYDKTPDELDMTLLSKMSDEYIRTTLLSTGGDSDINSFSALMDIIGEYEPMGIYILPSKGVEMTLLEESVEPGLLRCDGTVDEKRTGYETVTANVRSNTWICLNNRLDVSAHMPHFALYGADGNPIYIHQVGEEIKQADDCLPVGVTIVNCTLKYSIPTGWKDEGGGLFAISDTVENLKNMLAIVKDVVTGRIFAITAAGSYVTGKIIEAATSRIYIKKTINN